jgi:hypothetical protein
MFMKQERDYLAIFSVYGGGSAYARMSTEVAAVKHAARQAFYSYDIPEGAEMGITVHDVTGYKTVTWENGAVGLTGWKTSEAYESDPMNLEGTGDDLDDRHVRLIVIRAPNRKKRMFDEKLSAQIVDAYCNIPTVPKNKGIGSR